MRLKCLGSSSAGNCYLLTSESGETLILDCGIPIKEIKKGLDWNIRNVVGCIVSHVHSDHSKSVKDFKAMGIPVFAPYISEKPMKIGNEDFRSVQHVMISLFYCDSLLCRSIGSGVRFCQTECSEFLTRCKIRNILFCSGVPCSMIGAQHKEVCADTITPVVAHTRDNSSTAIV